MFSAAISTSFRFDPNFFIDLRCLKVNKLVTRYVNKAHIAYLHKMESSLLFTYRTGLDFNFWFMQTDIEV